jgi:hypothetical protein
MHLREALGTPFHETGVCHFAFAPLALAVSFRGGLAGCRARVIAAASVQLGRRAGGGRT